MFVLLLAGTLNSHAQQTLTNSQLRKLQLAEAAINRFYVDSVAEDQVVESAIKAMLKDLDPHSTYSNAEEVKKLTEPLNGSFEGIGVSFNMVEDTLVVIRPTVKGPSEKVGILPGDHIIAVNDTAIAGVNMAQSEIMKRLRGPKGSTVNLSVDRMGAPDILKFNVVREKIPVNSLNAAYLLSNGIGYVQFDEFGNNTYSELMNAIDRLQADGMESLIIDLQNNTGGYLDAAVKIANEFLNAEEPIVYTEGRASKRKEYRANGRGSLKSVPLVVLVNQNSASAAEILAGAIQDNDRGTIVGRRTYGKGLVQRPIELPDGSMIRLTIARYYTPSGRCIQKPYVKGDKESYILDIRNRSENGELLHEDSVKLDKSVEYHTLKDNRVVYGGGGVMPDFFVPVDTTLIGEYYSKLSLSNAVRNTTIKYVNNHRKELEQKYPTFNDFYAHFETGKDLIDELITEGKKNKVEYDAEGLKHDEDFIKLQLKALVARDLWDTSEYNQIMGCIDPVLSKAVELLTE